MIRAIIIEDELNNRELLENMLTHYVEGVSLLGHADSVEEGIALIRDKKPQVIFLDIEIKGGTGFDILAEFPKPDFTVIFTTGYDQYAIKAIKYSALDYLLKPISLEELREAVVKIKEKIISDEGNNESVLFLSGYKANRLIQCSQIIYVETVSGYTTFVLHDNSRVTTSYTIEKYKSLLPEYIIRIHRSYLININKVEKLDFGRGGFIHLTDGTKLPIAYRRKAEIKKLLQTNKNH